MGLPNFRSLVLESAGRLIDLRDYENLRIAIDISTWIYKACQANSYMLADEKHMSNYGRANLLFQQEQAHAVGELTESEKRLEEFIAKCCTNVIDRLQALHPTKLEILVVFDGQTPPIKETTVKDRRTKRAEEERQRDAPTGQSPSMERRIQANKRAGAGEHYTKVVEAILESLRNHKIPFLVSPFEADGQLAFLQVNGYVDLIITEDSDLLAYGVATPILYKLTVNAEGAFTRGNLIRKDDLAAKLPGDKNRFDFMDFSPAMLACLFAAAGGDYCESLRGIGAGTACGAVRNAFLSELEPTRPPPLQIFLNRLFELTWGRLTMSETDKKVYERNFLEALFMYRHAIVFDPVHGKACHLIPLDKADKELVSYRPYKDLVSDTSRHAAIVGRKLPPKIATHIAEGWIDPNKLKHVVEGPVDPKKMKFRANAPDYVRKDYDAFIATHRQEDTDYGETGQAEMEADGRRDAVDEGVAWAHERDSNTGLGLQEDDAQTEMHQQQMETQDEEVEIETQEEGTQVETEEVEKQVEAREDVVETQIETQEVETQEAETQKDSQSRQFGETGSTAATGQEPSGSHGYTDMKLKVELISKLPAKRAAADQVSSPSNRLSEGDLNNVIDLVDSDDDVDVLETQEY